MEIHWKSKHLRSEDDAPAKGRIEANSLRSLSLRTVKWWSIQSKRQHWRSEDDAPAKGQNKAHRLRSPLKESHMHGNTWVVFVFEVGR